MTEPIVKIHLFVEHRDTVVPRVDDVLDPRVHLCASRFPVETRHEQVVVVGVDMADGSDMGKPRRIRVLSFRRHQ